MSADLTEYLERQFQVKRLQEQVHALTIQLAHERCIRYYLEGYRNKQLSRLSGYSIGHCDQIIREYKKALGE